MEYERYLNILETKKEELTNRIKANEEWAKNYDLEVGPFANR